MKAQLQDLNESMNKLAESARKATISVTLADYLLRLIYCRSGQQMRKIRHELLTKARLIECNCHDTIGTTGYLYMLDRAKELREVAETARKSLSCN